MRSSIKDLPIGLLIEPRVYQRKDVGGRLKHPRMGPLVWCTLPSNGRVQTVWVFSIVPTRGLIVDLVITPFSADAQLVAPLPERLAADTEFFCEVGFAHIFLVLENKTGEVIL